MVHEKTKVWGESRMKNRGGRPFHSRNTKPTKYSEHVASDHKCSSCSRTQEDANFSVLPRANGSFYVSNECNICKHDRAILRKETIQEERKEKVASQKTFKKRWGEIDWKL